MSERLNQSNSHKPRQFVNKAEKCAEPPPTIDHGSARFMA
jgi:hypothetical protein